jgi:hypothetical protein
MRDLLLIVAVLLAICAGIWVYLKAAVLLEEWSEKRFGQSWRSLRSPRHEPPKVEIQTLSGNTKDQDQL